MLSFPLYGQGNENERNCPNSPTGSTVLTLLEMALLPKGQDGHGLGPSLASFSHFSYFMLPDLQVRPFDRKTPFFTTLHGSPEP